MQVDPKAGAPVETPGAAAVPPSAPAPTTGPVDAAVSPSSPWYLALGQWYTSPRTTAPPG